MTICIVTLKFPKLGVYWVCSFRDLSKAENLSAIISSKKFFFLFPLAFLLLFFCNSNYMYVLLFKVVLQLPNAWLCFILIFSNFSLWVFFRMVSMSIFSSSLFFPSKMSNTLLTQFGVVFHPSIVLSAWEVLVGSFFYLLSTTCSISP